MEKEIFDKAVKLNNDISFLKSKIEELKSMNGEDSEIIILVKCRNNSIRISGYYKDLNNNIENYMIYFLRPKIQQEFEKRLAELETEFKNLA